MTDREGLQAFAAEGEYISAMLGDLYEKTERTLINAINMAGRKVRSKIVKDAKGDYLFTGKGADGLSLKGFRFSAARMGEGVATLTARGAMTELINFMVNPRDEAHGADRPEVYAAHVLRRTAPKLLDGEPKPFVTTFRSGHTAIVVRVPGKHMRSDPTRDAVEKLLSPAVPHMLKNAAIRNDAEGEFFRQLPTAVNRAIASTLKRAGEEYGHLVGKTDYD